MVIAAITRTLSSHCFTNLELASYQYSSKRLCAKAMRLNYFDQKTLAIETGIQNSGLGLIIIFTFFNGNGGMAIVAAWWGVWHIISGFTIAYLFQLSEKRRTRKLTHNRA